MFHVSIPQARGVSDDATRASLVHAFDRVSSSPDPSLLDDPPHTGAGALPSSSTSSSSSSPSTAAPLGAGALGARVLALHALLGSRPDIDTAAMVARMPDLVTALPPGAAAERVVAMKGAGVPGADVASLIASRPALLLQPPPVSPEAPAARLAAWRAGLAGDGEVEWGLRLEELKVYVSRFGDAAVGARAGDAAAGFLLVRWAARQRAAAKSGELSAERRAALETLGFEFDGEEAEWRFWAGRAAAQAAAEGKGSLPGALAAGTSTSLSAASDGLALENWKSVQRVARRAGVLSEARVAALEEWGFDWTGADALS